MDITKAMATLAKLGVSKKAIKSLRVTAREIPQPNVPVIATGVPDDYADQILDRILTAVLRRIQAGKSRRGADYLDTELKDISLMFTGPSKRPEKLTTVGGGEPDEWQKSLWENKPWKDS